MNDPKTTKQPEPGSRDESVFDIAVIGAGASGTLVIAHLHALDFHGGIAFIGTGERPGRGVAYGTEYKSHLLNVRAGNMSAFPSQRDHFVRWLEEREPHMNAKTFVPRKMYGDYLADILNKASSESDSILKIDGMALEVTRKNKQWTIHLEDGNLVNTRNVVLALGNMPPDDPRELRGNRSPYYFSNPWAPNIARGLTPDASVLLIGTGLTMIDTVLSLRDEGHRGKIHVLSRHGRMPESHKNHLPRPVSTLPDAFGSVVGAMHWLRAEIEKAEEEECDWRAVIDCLRPHTAEIWSKWDQAQRSAFLRHVRNIWDVHRHRVAPEIHEQIHNLMETGTLINHVGHIVSLDSTIQGAILNWCPSGSDKLQSIQAARVINCTGPIRDYERVELPLVASLRTAGWLTPDALKLGIETDQDGHLLGKDGNVIDGLFTLGPLRIAGLWESIAIPEIRGQAAELAKLLVDERILLS